MSRGLLKLEGVGKRFHRGAAHDRLGELISDGIRRALGRPSERPNDAFWALENVSFEVGPGEALGLVGPNGAGKSTALKLIAGILRADRGIIRRRGRVTALIEVSAGFHGDLTGRENVYMNASVLGMRKAEIERKLDAIIEFSGIGEFIDTPVKRYSSGMQARLGFSVAAHVEPDVLLVDEVLSVGDVAFRQKCVNRMRELVNDGAVLLFVTHQLEQMQSFCTRAIVLDRGRVAFDGDTHDAVACYLSALQSASPMGSMALDGEMEFVHPARIRSSKGNDLGVIASDEPLVFEVRFDLSRPYRELAAEVDVRRDVGTCLVNFSSIRDGVTYCVAEGDGRIELSVPSLPLGGGEYLLRTILRDAESGQLVGDSGYCRTVFVEDRGRPTGILCLPHAWELCSIDAAQSEVGSIESARECGVKKVPNTMADLSFQ